MNQIIIDPFVEGFKETTITEVLFAIAVGRRSHSSILYNSLAIINKEEFN